MPKKQPQQSQQSQQSTQKQQPTQQQPTQQQVAQQQSTEQRDQQQRLHTYLQHAGLAPFGADGSAAVPLPAERSSTVRFQSMAQLEQAQAQRAQGSKVPPVYGRAGMSTHRALEEVFCTLEQGCGAFLLPSGMAAISHALFSFLQQGDHVLFADCVYGPVRRFASTMLRRMGVEYTYCVPTVQAFEAARQPNTKVLYVESPGSLLMQMLDLPALTEWAHQHGLVVMTDNTWGSGYSYQPLALGVDISIVSGTKYISGHSDLMLGAVVTRHESHVALLNDVHYTIGFALSADDAWLALRGVRTMPLRMQQSARSALAVCTALQQWPEVQQIYHPAWPGDPGHALWQRDALGANGLLSVALSLSPDQTRRLVDALELFAIGFSWGGFESLVQWVSADDVQPHSYWPHGSTAQLLRLQIGLEDSAALIADLQQAYEQALRG